MCEEEPAVRALSFLQTEVSSVVDHSSMDEAALFRSLLTHLLNPVTQSRPTIASTGGRGRRNEHGQSHQHQEGSRKRSRSEDDWTNRLSGESDEDVDMSNETFEPSTGIMALTMGEDPLEHSIRNPPVSASTPPDTGPDLNDPRPASEPVAVSTLTSANQPPLPSPTRFKQRVEVFEALLEFVNENVKEPSGNLLDCINVMEGF
jgi:muskelin